MQNLFYNIGYYLFYLVLFFVALFCLYKIRKNKQMIDEYKKEHPEYSDKDNK